MSAGSIYDSERGGKKPRYSIDGRVGEGMIVDSDGRDVTSNTTGSTAGLSLDDLLARLRQATGLPAPQDSRTSISEALAKYRQIRDAEAKFPNPGTADLEEIVQAATVRPTYRQ